MKTVCLLALAFTALTLTGCLGTTTSETLVDVSIPPEEPAAQDQE